MTPPTIRRLAEETEVSFFPEALESDAEQRALPAGTLVRDVHTDGEPDRMVGRPATWFFASVDNGQSWGRYRTWGELHTVAE